MKTPQVRGMQLNDIDTVYAIELVAHIAPWSREILHDCVLVGYDCRVLEVDNTLASYVINRYYENICHVLNLCVAPASQNKGYGRFLLQNVIDSLKDTDFSTVLLEVRPSNAAALHLYRKMGFRQVGIKKDYYSEGPELEDAIVLQKNLSAI